MKEVARKAIDADRLAGVSVMTGNGQITIPEAIRDALGLSAWDRVILELEAPDDGRAILRPVRTEADHRHADELRQRQPIELDEARRIFTEEMAESGMREGLPHDRS